MKTPDTDVLVLATHYYPKMTHVKELWIETGTVTRMTRSRRFIPIHEICSVVPPILCEILPSVHALTGCDSTSAFFGIGKKTVYKATQDHDIEMH